MDSYKIKAHLCELLKSKEFVNAPQLCRFLKFIVEETLAGRGAQVNEFQLALSVFDRKSDFSPKVDTIVRVQAGRLRSKLLTYYSRNKSEIRISIRKGRYFPEFEEVILTSLKRETLAVISFPFEAPDNDKMEEMTNIFTEELVHAISQIPNVLVSSVTQKEWVSKTSSNIGYFYEQFGIQFLVRVTLRAGSETNVVIVQVVNAQDGFIEMSEKWQQSGNDLLKLTAEIARHIATFKGWELPPSLKRIENVEAVKCYLRGRHFWNQRTEHGFKRGIENFEQALDIDPEMCRAWAALSESYLLQAMHGIKLPRAALKRALAAAEQGLLFNRNSAPCHAALASARLFLNRDMARAEQSWRHALDLDPHYANAWHSYGVFLLTLSGRWSDAILALSKAGEIDPLSAPIANDMGFVLFWGGRVKEAKVHCLTVIDHHPWFYRTYMLLARCCVLMGDYSEALSVAQSALPLFKGKAFYTYHLATIGYIYAKMRKPGKANNILNILNSELTHGYGSTLDPALVLYGLGKESKAAELIREAERDHNPWALLRRLDPIWNHC